MILNPTTKKSFILYSSNTDFVIPHAIEGMRYWDFATTNKIHRLARCSTGNNVFVDCGANIGTSSLLASETFYSVVCFEAIQANIDILIHNLRANNVRALVYRNAVSNKTGEEVSFSGDLNGNSGVASVAAFGGPANPSKPRESVLSIRLDDALKNTQPAFIHIDTEGYDLLCLEGSMGIVSADLEDRSHRPFFEIEFCPEAFMRYCKNLDILWYFLQSYSYKPFILTNNHLAPLSTEILKNISTQWIEAGGSCWMDILLIPAEINPRQFYSS